MKKLLLALLYIPALCIAQTRTEAAMQLQYQPQTVYTITQNSSTDMTMNYIGSEELLSILKEQGVDNPMIKKEQNNSVIELSTGRPGAKNEYPVEMRFLSSDNEAIAKYIKPTTVIYGHGTTAALPVFDSISDKKLGKEFTEAFLTTMQSILSQIKYPDQKVKVGQVASTDMPISIPLGPVVINMNINTSYKLMSIKGDIAEYDMEMVFTVTSTIKEYNILGGGGGSGKMTFDLANNFYKSYTLDMDMDMSADMGQAELHLKMKQKGSATAQVKRKK